MNNIINVVTKITPSFLIGVFLTAISYLAVHFMGMQFELNWLEFFAVATSYSCTYLCVMQSRLNYPIGVLTTFLYSILFFQWGLFALSLFNLYLVFSLIYGWFRWGSDENTRPVTNLKLDKWLLGYVGIGIGVYALLAAVNWSFGTEMSTLDIWAAVLSGVAQFMLDNKRLQTWFLWAIVNILSIWLFYTTGLYLVLIQYIFFLGNAVFGYVMWKKSMKKETTNHA